MDTNNRQLHLDEEWSLDKLMEGKTEEEQHRFVAAACALVKCGDGLDDLDPAKSNQLKLQAEGAEYFLEQQQLIKASNYSFYYSPNDAENDAFTAQGWVQNAEGLWSPPIRSPYPDYLSANANIYIANGGVSINLHTMDIYGQWGLGKVYPYSTQPGVTVSAGYITGLGNTAYLTDSFLKGGSAAGSYTVPSGLIPLTGVTFGVNNAYGGATASEIGLSFPVTKPTVVVNPLNYGVEIKKEGEN